MSKKVYLIFAVALIFTLTTSACERPAALAPLSASTSTDGEPFAVGMAEDDPMKMLQAYATQTAMAAGLQPVATSTPLTPQPDLTAALVNTVTVTGTLPTDLTPTATGLLPPTGTATSPTTPTTPTTPIVITITPPARPATYTLQAGEFPYCIARRFNLDPQKLLDANGLTDGGMYLPGLTLSIPQTGIFPGDRALRSHPATYTVAANETIYKIACYYGDVSPDAIAAANSLTPPYALTVGQALNIP